MASEQPVMANLNRNGHRLTSPGQSVLKMIQTVHMAQMRSYITQVQPLTLNRHRWLHDNRLIQTLYVCKFLQRGICCKAQIQNKPEKLFKSRCALSQTRGTKYHRHPRSEQLATPAVLQDDLLCVHHHSLAGGGQSVDRTYQAIKLKYFGSTMHGDVKGYVESYVACQRSKRVYINTKSPLNPLPVVDICSLAQ